MGIAFSRANVENDHDGKHLCTFTDGNCGESEPFEGLILAGCDGRFNEYLTNLVFSVRTGFLYFLLDSWPVRSSIGSGIN